MKKARLIVVLAVIIGLAGFLAAPQASAQVLDGKWFRLNCTIKAMQVNETTGVMAPFNLNFTAYMYFMHEGWTNGTALYYIEVWSRTAPGHWVMTNNENLNPTLPWSDLVFPDFGIQFYGEGKTYIISYITPFVNNKLTTLFAQGEIFGGLNSAGNAIYGGITIQGSAVSAPPFVIPVIK